ncbi:MAG: T9SS type A sorting domain-containing protein [Bacteroidales bacterium]
MKKCYILIAFLFVGLYSFAETKLSKPVLIAPVDNAIGQMPNVLLNWDPVSGNIGLTYTIQVDTSITFSHPIELQTELSSIRPSGLLFATKYYWRVCAVDNSGTSVWSDIRPFTVLTTVTLGSPAVNATKVMPNAEIQWTIMTGVNYFDIQLDTVANFDSPFSKVISVVGSVNKTNLSNLYFNKKYYRRMRARHDNDISDWSASRAFTTRKTITLSAPDSLAVDQDLVVQFKWTAITGINKYIIILADNPEFNFPASVESTVNNLNSDTLKFGVKYYWKVNAIHAVDMVSSPVRSFTTKSTVELVAPANNQTGVELAPVFSWKPIKGSERYDLLLADNDSFENAINYKVDNSNPVSGSFQKFQLPAYILDSAEVKFWKVRAIISGDSSSWSNTYTFKVATLGIDPLLLGNSAMSVFPNPAKEKIQVIIRSTERSILSMSISNLLGNTLISDKVQFANGRSISDINVNSLPNGIYFVKIQKESSVFMSKLIIDR